MKTRVWIVAFLSIIASLILSPTVLAQDRNVIWQRWDVVIDNIDTSNNRFDVAEIYEITFTNDIGSNPFTYGYAQIPINRLDSLTDVRVYEDGQLLTESCSGQAGTYCARNTHEGLEVEYFFRQSIFDANQSFRIEYTVTGALRSYEGGDQLWWGAIPEDHPGLAINEALVVVNMPSNAIPREGIDPAETYGEATEIRTCATVQACADIERLPELVDEVDGVLVVAELLSAIYSSSGSIEIRVQYPHNAAMTTPSWQSNFDFWQSTGVVINYVSLLSGIMIALGGILGSIGLYYTKGRDPRIGVVPDYLSEPPSDLRPAVVGTLIDEKADLRDVLSTLIDLAHRGYIVIEENRTEGIVLGIGAKTEFVFKRTDQSISDLQAYEQRVVDRVFGARDVVELDSLKNKFYRYIPRLQEDLYKELLTHHFFAANPNITRLMWAGIGLVVTVLGVVGGVAAINFAENIPLLPFLPGSLVIVGIALMAISSFMPAKTREGAQEAAKWNAFREYLRNLEKYVDVEGAVEQFDRYLPYAVAFGMEKAWVRKFAGIDRAPIPRWYYPTHLGGRYSRGYTAGTPLPNFGSGDGFAGDLSLDSMSSGISGGLDSISDGLTDMLNSTSSVLRSQPSSSSSGGGFSGGGSGGGGFSGGGSRGFG